MYFINKLKTKIYEKRYILLSFFVPFLLSLAALLYVRIIFSNNVPLVSDLNAQYLSLLTEFVDMVKGNANIFYSFSKGLGGNMYGTYAYYLMSPLNLLLVLVPKALFTDIIMLIIIIKISLSSLFMHSFLKSVTKIDGNMFLIMFSSMYALMGFVVGYFFNIMWLDAVYILPLIALGINNIIKKEDIKLYVIALFLGIFTNFYLGYILCIFSFIYYISSLILTKMNKEKALRNFVLYGISSILSVISSAIILIPVYMEMKLFPKTMVTNIFSLDFKFNFNIFDTISRLYLGAQESNNMLNEFGVHAYSGILAILLVILYFLNKKINMKEKLVYGSILLFLMVSFSSNYLSYIWHGFADTQFFANRYSFIFSFFLILISVKSFLKIKQIKSNDYIIAGMIFTTITMIVLLFNYNYLNTYMLLASLALFIVYEFILYASIAYKDPRDVSILKKLLIVLVFAEIMFNFYICIYSYIYPTRREYNDMNSIVGNEISKLKKSNDNFYRIEKDFKFSNNDGFLFNYHGTEVFLSTISQKNIVFFHNNGYMKYVNSHRYSGVNPIIDSVLGVKSLIFKTSYEFIYDKVDSFGYSKYPGLLYGKEMKDINIYENKNALSLMYMIDIDCHKFNEKILSQKYLNYYVFSDTLLQTMTKKYQNVYERIELKKNKNREYEFVISSNKDIILNYYVIDLFEIDDRVLIYINDKISDVINSEGSSIFWLENKYKIGDKIKIRIELEGDAVLEGLPTAHYYHPEILKEQTDYLKENQLEIIENKEYYIKGVVTATEDKQVLFTSIPFEPGWTAYVDGVKTSIVELYDAFNGIKLTPGEHVIEFKFYPPGLNLGILVSLIGLLLTGIFIKYQKKIVGFLTNIYFKYEEVILYLIVGGITTLVGVLSYIVFAKLLLIPYMISNILSWLFAILFAFVANKWLVFKSVGKIIVELVEFIKYRLLSLLIDIAMMYTFVSLLKIDDVIAKLIVQVVIIIINYVFSKIFIFKK